MMARQEEEKKRQILCAVRGGRESRTTVSHGIRLALETGASLTFVHILDAEFLNYATIGPISVVYDALVEMGEFTMLILCDRAQRRGVQDVDYVVRKGNIRKQLRRMAVKTKAEVLVMGRPVRSPGSNVFRRATIGPFADELAQSGGLRVDVVSEEGVERHGGAS